MCNNHERVFEEKKFGNELLQLFADKVDVDF